VIAPWWQTGVFYQIYPRSFATSRGEPTGDLAGVEAHLDHVEWLGVDAVWLSPFYPSPMADFGYDVADYCDVDPVFGDLAAFDRLLAACHRRGLKLLVDLVPNHSSDQHPWFVAARSSRDDPKRDWYIWRDGSPDMPPNNWLAAFIGGPAWTWEDATQQWYLHQFLPQQPDLNWANPAVVDAVHDVMRFWLERGARPRQGPGVPRRSAGERRHAPFGPQRHGPDPRVAQGAAQGGRRLPRRPAHPG
jgi:glycosidase